MTGSPEPRFVLHEHFARHHHFDLRPGHDGVLKSWAVQKGMPEKSGERRLAIAVEDHAMESIGFEGTIPEGEYGAGEVKIRSTGTFRPSSGRKTGSRPSSTAGSFSGSIISSVSAKAVRTRGSS